MNIYAALAFGVVFGVLPAVVCKFRSWGSSAITVVWIAIGTLILYRILPESDRGPMLVLYPILIIVLIVRFRYGGKIDLFKKRGAR